MWHPVGQLPQYQPMGAGVTYLDAEAVRLVEVKLFHQGLGEMGTGHGQLVPIVYADLQQHLSFYIGLPFWAILIQVSMATKHVCLHGNCIFLSQPYVYICILLTIASSTICMITLLPWQPCQLSYLQDNPAAMATMSTVISARQPCQLTPKNLHKHNWLTNLITFDPWPIVMAELIKPRSLPTEQDTVTSHNPLYVEVGWSIRLTYREGGALVNSTSIIHLHQCGVCVCVCVYVLSTRVKRVWQVLIRENVTSVESRECDKCWVERVWQVLSRECDKCWVERVWQVLSQESVTSAESRECDKCWVERVWQVLSQECDKCWVKRVWQVLSWESVTSVESRVWQVLSQESVTSVESRECDKCWVSCVTSVESR